MVEYEAQEGREGSEHDVQVATDRNDEDEDELLLARDSLRSFVQSPEAADDTPSW